MANNERVSLGCGTLILIALIVLIFSNRQPATLPNLDRELRKMQTQIDLLRQAVDRQTERITELEKTLTEEP